MILIEIIYIIALLIVGLCFSVLIHELGHLVGGMLTGYVFDSLYFSNFLIYKEDNRLKLKIRKMTLYNICHGQCIIIPNQDYKQYRPFWSNLTGPLFSLFTGFILVIAMSKIEREFWLLNSFLNQLVYQNFAVGLFALIPYRMSYQQSDGYNIIRGFYPIDRRSMFVYETFDSAIKAGKRLSDFDSTLLLVKPEEKIKNFWFAFLVTIYALHLADKGDQDSAIKEFNRINFKLLPSSIKCEIKCELLYYYLIYNFNERKCKKIYEDNELQSYIRQNKVTPKRVFAAYTWIVLGETYEGEQLLKEAIALAKELEGGYQVMELDRIEDFIRYKSTI